MSYKVEVTDGSGYASNGLRFNTQAGAEAYAVDLACRWTSVKDWRVVESADPATDSYEIRKTDEALAAANEYVAIDYSNSPCGGCGVVGGCRCGEIYPRCDDPGAHQANCKCDGGEPRL